jgi:hypothetical protein
MTLSQWLFRKKVDCCHISQVDLARYQAEVTITKAIEQQLIHQRLKLCTVEMDILRKHANCVCGDEECNDAAVKLYVKET